jgi:hypothetical protein
MISCAQASNKTNKVQPVSNHNHDPEIIEIEENLDVNEFGPTSQNTIQSERANYYLHKQNFIEVNSGRSPKLVPVPYSMNIVVNNKAKIEKQKTVPFEEKLKNLKTQILIKKVSWRDGFCKLELNRDQVLPQSIKQIYSVDLYKELKIDFKGEVSYDAGGIIREWFTVLIRALESKELSNIN